MKAIIITAIICATIVMISIISRADDRRKKE